MRLATYNTNVYFNEHGLFFGVGFGNDACAEHEWGIESMKSRLGITATLEEDPTINN